MSLIDNRMERKNHFSRGILLAFMTLLSTMLTAQKVIPGEWIIKSTDPTFGAKAKKNSQISEVKSIFGELGLYLIVTSEERPINQIKKSLKSTQIDGAYPNQLIEPRYTPDDPDFPGQWAATQIGMPEIWDVTTGGQAPNGDDIVVAIFDDGYDITHRDYADNIWTNEGEIPDDGIDNDGNGYIDDYLGWNATTDNDEHRNRTHGTAVAGIIGAVGDNGVLVAGMNWDVKLMLTSGGREAGFNIADIVRAYEYIYTQRRIYNETQGESGAYVVVSNYSGGASGLFPEDFPSWCEIYDLLGSVGVINFTSAPNADVDVDTEGDLPSTCLSDYLIIVTNTDRQDNKVQAAGYGAQSVDLGAPGDEIYTTGLNGELNTSFSGASASAPVVAGVASLLYSVICDEAYELSITDPRSIVLELRRTLLTTVSPVPELIGRSTTGGRLDAAAAFAEWRSIKGIADCCKVDISDLTIIDESCIEATDGQLNIMTDTTDTRSALSYTLSPMSGMSVSNRTGEFRFLEAGNYELSVTTDRDMTCRADTTLSIAAGIDECSFGEFQISGILPNPTSDFINVSFELDELKHFEIVIFDYASRLIYRKPIIPSSTSARSEQIDVSDFPDGIYYIGIRANDLVDFVPFSVFHP